MNSQDAAEHVLQHALFKDLVTRRARLVWSLMAIGLCSYFTLIALVAFCPEALRMPVEGGAVMTVGVALAVAILMLGWIITWVYVHRANSTFDALSARLIDEVK